MPRIINLDQYQDNDMIDQPELCKILDIGTPKTLNQYRSDGTFTLKYYKIGRRIYYRVADIKKWLVSKPVDPVERKRERKEQANQLA